MWRFVGHGSFAAGSILVVFEWAGRSEVLEALVCPVCRADVEPRGSMCLSCHLPIKDVVANQAKKDPRATKLVRSGITRLTGLLFYSAVVLWCWYRLPDTLSFVVPGAVLGAVLHTGKARPWLGLLVFLLVVALVPALFWPSMLTGLVSDLTAR